LLVRHFWRQYIFFLYLNFNNEASSLQTSSMIKVYCTCFFVQANFESTKYLEHLNHLNGVIPKKIFFHKNIFFRWKLLHCSWPSEISVKLQLSEIITIRTYLAELCKSCKKKPPLIYNHFLQHTSIFPSKPQYKFKYPYSIH